MRPRRTLTARGVCMLVFGGIALVAGLVVGQLELVGVGVLLIAVPLLSALTVIGSVGRIVHSRTVLPTRVPAGHDARVMVRVGNSSTSWPVASVFVEDSLPVPLGAEPRYFVGHLGPRAVRDVTYLVRPAVRGRYSVGPLRISVSDPLGCVRLTRPVGAPSTLLVTPRTVPLGDTGGTDGSQGEESPRRSVIGAGEQDPVPREYQYGDELRRVHWRSTAKRGELMVRRDEQHWRERSAILLDTRAASHLGRGHHSSLETAVGVAASVSVNLIERQHELRLHTEGGRVQSATVSGVLDGLAVIEPSEASGLQGGIGMLASLRNSSPSLVVAILGALAPEETAALSRVGGRSTRIAVLCARAAWPSPESLRGTADLLTTAGWRVLTVSDPAELPHLWKRASASRLAAAGPRLPREGL